ncbi:MAG: porin [Pseudomonadales bacterium]
MTRLRHIITPFLLVWLLVAISSPVLAQQPKQTILLRNVLLMGHNGTEENTRVNILIKQSLLDIVTEDRIPIKDADVSYDADGGVVLGQLTLGEPATFLILDQDPRQNIEALLDTKTHASFAIHEGKVLKNTYVTVIAETEEEQKRAAAGWLAYAPPPLAASTDYQDKTKWNRYDGKFVTGLFYGVVVLDRQEWKDQDSASFDQVGDLTDFNGGEIRALRIGGVGTINFSKPWVWSISGATHAFDKGFDQKTTDQFSLYDLRLDIPLLDKASFSIGKQKEPISMERIMSMVDMPMQERAAVSDALLPSRNTGMVVAGSLLNDRATLAGGVFNDWLDKDQPSSFSDNGTQYVGRATWIPFLSENESTLLHLGGALRYSDAKEGVLSKADPEFNKSPAFVATDFLQPESTMTYQAEASLRSGPFWLHSEYIRAAMKQPQYDDPTLDGYHVTASWLLTGEVRPYNKRVGIFGGVPIARDVNHNGWGALEMSTRFSHLDLSEAPGPDDSDSGKMDIWSLGVNWWLSPYLNVNLNYRYITLDRFGEEGKSHGFNTRLMMVLE